MVSVSFLLKFCLHTEQLKFNPDINVWKTLSFNYNNNSKSNADSTFFVFPTSTDLFYRVSTGEFVADNEEISR